MLFVGALGLFSLAGGGLTPVTLGLQPRVARTAPDGASGSPVIAGEGRYVFFVSDARNVVTNGVESWGLNLYRWDRESSTTELVSTGMGNNSLASVGDYSVSESGERAVFSGLAIPFESPEEGNVFLRDIPAGTTTLISRRRWELEPVPGNGPSWDPILSEEGRWVVFASLATDLESGSGPSGQPGLVMHDLEAGESRRIAVNRFDGAALEYQASRDAGLVVFRNPERQYFPGGNRWTSLLIWRRTDASYRQVGLSLAPSEEMGAPMDPLIFSLSANGRRLAFYLGFRAGPNGRGIWIYDMETAAAERILPERPLGYFDQLSWNDDGSRLAVLEGRPEDGVQSRVHVWTAEAGVRQLAGWVQSGVSVPADPTAISRCELSPDGRYLLFRTAEGVPAAGVPEGGGEAHYLWELATGKTRLLAREQPDLEPAFSADGRWLAYQSSERLDPSDDNDSSDVFLMELPDGTPERVSLGLASAPLVTAGGGSWVDGGLSDDGRWIVFSSRADNLVPNDANDRQDVFVQDRLLRTNLMVSVNQDGGSAAAGARWGRISADGRSVVFLSDSPDLVPGVTNRFPNLFLRHLPSATTELVSVDPSGSRALGSKPLNVWVAGDGRRVMMELDAFEERNGVEFRGLPKLLVWDRGSGTTRNALEGLTNTFGFPRVHHPGSARFDRNGTLVAFSSGFEGEGTVEIRDLASGALTRVPVRSDSRVVDFSQDGRRVLTRFGPTEEYDPVQDAWVTTLLSYAVFERHSGRVILPDFSQVLATSMPQFTGDGCHLYFVGRSVNGEGVATQRQMFLYSLLHGTITRVHAEAGGIYPAWDYSKAQITPDMRWIVFTTATPGEGGLDSNETLDVFIHDRYAGETRLVSAGADGRTGNGPSVGGHLSADGRFFAFTTFAGDLVPGDDSRYSDVVWGTVEPMAPLDADADGLPDVWERDCFGSLAEGASGDPDRDGQNNRDEFLTRTIPSDAASRLSVIGSQALPGGVQVSWDGRAGVSYRLERSEALGAGAAWSPTGDAVAGYEGRMHQVVPEAVVTAFFRVVVAP
ncbi:MAG: PD40 domain-containing protein [Verrucomicrobia bacterium]|nr:PD40 domain-containing protein [Verrucomicrobiota bacterium]